MKAYVVRYRTSPEDSRRIDVMYAPDLSPESRYASRQLAEAACRNLNGFEVRVGMHQCAFSVDPLPDGGFGVHCVCHPALNGAQWNFFLLKSIADPVNLEDPS